MKFCNSWINERDLFRKSDEGEAVRGPGWKFNHNITGNQLEVNVFQPREWPAGDTVKKWRAFPCFVTFLPGSRSSRRDPRKRLPLHSAGAGFVLDPIILDFSIIVDRFFENTTCDQLQYRAPCHFVYGPCTHWPPIADLASRTSVGSAHFTKEWFSTSLTQRAT